MQCAVKKAILEVESSGELTPESKASLQEYQRQHLERRLACYGVLLQPWQCDSSGDLVTYRGELHGKHGIHRVLCRVPAPSKLSNTDELGDCMAENTLLQHIDVLQALEGNDKHFVNMLAFDQTSSHKFYIIDQDWELENLSHVLLSDLLSGHQTILLKHKMVIINDMIEAALFAHQREILVRSFTAESFLVERHGTEMRAIFWDIDAARRGVWDSVSMNSLHFTGNSCIV